MAVEELQNCAKIILCGLSGAAQAQLKSLISTYVGVLEGQIGALEAQLVVLDILTAPVEIARNAANEVGNQVKQGLKIVPTGLVADCVGLNVIPETIERNVDIVLQDINLIATDLERLLSFRDEIEALIDDFREALEVYSQILTNFDLCEEIKATIGGE